MAPEVLQKQPTTAASDVYAWAVTVNEIATGIFPFADCTKDNPQCQTVLNFGYGRLVSRLMPLHCIVWPTAFRSWLNHSPSSSCNSHEPSHAKHDVMTMCRTLGLYGIVSRSKIGID